MKELLDLPGLTVDAVWGQAEPVLLKKDDIENMPQETEIKDSCNGNAWCLAELKTWMNLSIPLVRSHEMSTKSKGLRMLALVNL